MSAEKLPDLLDVGGIMRETGLKRRGAEAIMRHCTKVEVPGFQKTFVRRSEILQKISEWTKAA